MLYKVNKLEKLFSLATKLPGYNGVVRRNSADYRSYLVFIVKYVVYTNARHQCMQHSLRYSSGVTEI